jgi:hypothetical protein
LWVEIGVKMNENPFLLVFFNTWPSSLHGYINLNAGTHNMMNIPFINLINIMPLTNFHEWKLRLTWILMGLKLTWYKTKIAKHVKKLSSKLPILNHTNGLETGNVCTKSIRFISKLKNGRSNYIKNPYSNFRHAN